MYCSRYIKKQLILHNWVKRKLDHLKGAGLIIGSFKASFSFCRELQINVLLLRLLLLITIARL